MVTAGNAITQPRPHARWLLLPPSLPPGHSSSRQQLGEAVPGEETVRGGLPSHIPQQGCTCAQPALPPVAWLGMKPAWGPRWPVRHWAGIGWVLAPQPSSLEWDPELMSTHSFPTATGRYVGRRKWQPTPVFLPGKSHGWRSAVDYSPWGRKESDMTERLHFHFLCDKQGHQNSESESNNCLTPRSCCSVLGTLQNTWPHYLIRVSQESRVQQQTHFHQSHQGAEG